LHQNQKLKTTQTKLDNAQKILPAPESTETAAKPPSELAKRRKLAAGTFFDSYLSADNRTLP
jgi:hypothetical protein